MLRNKGYCFGVLIILISILFTGCIEEQEIINEIKYKSIKDVTLKEKQGRMSFNISIRTNDTVEKALRNMSSLTFAPEFIIAHNQLIKLVKRQIKLKEINK